MSFGAFGVSARQTAQMTSAARKVVPVRSIRIDQGSPSASRISGMSTVSASPPIAVISRPLRVIGVGEWRWTSTAPSNG